MSNSFKHKASSLQEKKTVVCSSGKNKKKYQQKKFRSSLALPFLGKWPTLNEGSSALILKRLSQCYAAAFSRTRREEMIVKSPSFYLKQRFVFGINEVSQLLLSLEAVAVIIQRHERNASMLQHIPMMSAMRSIPCVCIAACGRMEEALHFEGTLSALAVKKLSADKALEEAPISKPSSAHYEELIPLETYPSSEKTSLLLEGDTHPLEAAVELLVELIRERLAEPLEIPFFIPSHTHSISAGPLLPLQLLKVDTTPNVDIRAYRRKERRKLRRERRKNTRALNERGGSTTAGGAAVLDSVID